MGPASARASASRPRRFALVLGAALAIVGFGEAARVLVSPAAHGLALDIGPNTGPYLEGFTDSEERLPATFRWTRERASVSLPLTRRGGGRLTMRYARFLPGNARVRVFLDGSPAASFSARSGRFRTQELELNVPDRESAGPLRLELLVEDPSPEGLGIAVDWMRFEDMTFGLRSWAPRALLGGLVLLAAAAGLSLPAVVVLGAAVALGQAAGFAWSPFAATHIQAQIAASALIATALVGFFLREPRLALFFLVGLVLKGSALFHPSYFYPDVRLHRRHLEAFVAADGGIVARGIAAQEKAYTAYPRFVAGKPYAFPYSPVFYLPFTLLEREARQMEALMKHTGLLLAALEVPLVFLLARSLLGTSPALWAALLTAFLPPVTSRMLYAQWPTLAGHVLDIVALCAAARLVANPAAPPTRALFNYGASMLAACLTYISSILNLTIFTSLLAVSVRDRRSGAKLVLLGAAVALATVLLLYLPFVRLFFTEMLPAFGEGGGSGTPAAGIASTLSRVHMFYGFAYIGFAAAGMWLVKRESGGAFRFLVVYGASFLVLLALRAGMGMFKDLKELVYVGPFVAMTCGVFLDGLWAPARLRRVSAWAVAAGLVAFSLGKHLEYFRMHTTLAP